MSLRVVEQCVAMMNGEFKKLEILPRPESGRLRGPALKLLEIVKSKDRPRKAT